MNFYPRPPRGGRPYRSNPPAVWQKISIHALREEGDKRLMDCPAYRDAFLSTPSARRATGYRRGNCLQRGHFYPRPPRGGRRCSTAGLSPRRSISIHALREEGDDLVFVDYDNRKIISIHALREEGDRFRDGTHIQQLLISIHALREEGDRNIIRRR